MHPREDCHHSFLGTSPTHRHLQMICCNMDSRLSPRSESACLMERHICVWTIPSLLGAQHSRMTLWGRVMTSKLEELSSSLLLWIIFILLENQRWEHRRINCPGSYPQKFLSCFTRSPSHMFYVLAFAKSRPMTKAGRFPLLWPVHQVTLACILICIVFSSFGVKISCQLFHIFFYTLDWFMWCRNELFFSCLKIILVLVYFRVFF